MALYGKEKIWFLMNRLQDARDITPVGEPVSLHLMDELNGHYQPQDLISLLNKLEKEEDAVKLLSLPTDQTNHKYVVKLMPGFDHYVDVIRLDPKYQEWTGIKTIPDVQVGSAKPNTILTISYAKSREIVLNGLFQLAKPNLNSENDVVFQYLYDHPNTSFTKTQLESALSTKITKPLHKIVENLGFKPELSKVFFSVSKNSIEFRNPVSKTELAEAGISLIKL